MVGRRVTSWILRLYKREVECVEIDSILSASNRPRKSATTHSLASGGYTVTRAQDNMALSFTGSSLSMRALYCALAVSLTTSALSAATRIDEPKTFVTEVYRHYMSSTSYSAPEDIYTPRLARLFR